MDEEADLWKSENSFFRVRSPRKEDDASADATASASAMARQIRSAIFIDHIENSIGK